MIFLWSSMYFSPSTGRQKSTTTPEFKTPFAATFLISPPFPLLPIFSTDIGLITLWVAFFIVKTVINNNWHQRCIIVSGSVTCLFFSVRSRFPVVSQLPVTIGAKIIKWDCLVRHSRRIIGGFDVQSGSWTGSHFIWAQDLSAILASSFWNRWSTTSILVWVGREGKIPTIIFFPEFYQHLALCCCQFATNIAISIDGSKLVYMFSIFWSKTDTTEYHLIPKSLTLPSLVVLWYDYRVCITDLVPRWFGNGS